RTFQIISLSNQYLPLSGDPSNQTAQALACRGASTTAGLTSSLLELGKSCFMIVRLGFTRQIRLIVHEQFAETRRTSRLSALAMDHDGCHRRHAVLLYRDQSRRPLSME